MAWIATKRFIYGGHELFPGEFCEPKGLRNDRVIFMGDSRWVQTVAKEHDDWPCDRCGRRFQGEQQLRAHQRSLYGAEQVTPERAKELKQQRDKRTRRALEQETPEILAQAAGMHVENRGDIPIIVQR